MLRSKFTDEKHPVYLRWDDRDRARYEPEMIGPIGRISSVSIAVTNAVTDVVTAAVTILDRGFSSSSGLPM